MDLDFNKNEDNMKQALVQLRNRYQKIAIGGGTKSIEKQHEKNKLTARERIAYLVDKDSVFYEIGAFAGYEMYEEYGGCPAAGTVVVAERHDGPVDAGRHARSIGRDRHVRKTDLRRKACEPWQSR